MPSTTVRAVTARRSSSAFRPAPRRSAPTRSPERRRWFIGQNGEPARQLLYAETFMRYAAFGRPDANYDVRRFDFDKDPARLDEMRALINANNPDLSDFRSRG